MSYFTADDSTTSNGNPAPQQTGESDQDYLARVAEAKGENWKDPNVLAKGYLSSQEHIGNLERQIAEMREDLGKQDYMKEVLDRLDQKQQTPSTKEPESSNTGGTEQGTPAEVSVDQIKELVVKTLTEREAKNTAAQNLKEADEKLTSLFGTEAPKKVEEVRQRLGMSKERLQELASESPTAFMTLIGQPDAKQTNRSLADSSMNTEKGFDNSSSKRDWAYYQKMRKDNPKQYYTGSIQNQMLKDRQDLGDSFY